MKKNADRFVHAIFCDDIRQETGNKVSFMGCYQGELFVPLMPLALPKLCVYVTISTLVARPLKALTIRVDQRETKLVTIEIPSEDLARLAPPPQEDATRILVNAIVILSPFAITEPSEIRVVVITEDGEMLGPRLRIKVMPQAEVAVAAPAEPVAATVATRKAATKKAATPSAPVRRIGNSTP